MNPALFIPARKKKRSKRTPFYSYDDIISVIGKGGKIESVERVVENGKNFYELLIAGVRYRVSKANAEKLTAGKE